MGELRLAGQERALREWERMRSGAGAVELDEGLEWLPGVHKAAMRKALERFEELPLSAFWEAGSAQIARWRPSPGGRVKTPEGDPRAARALAFEAAGSADGRLVWVVSLEGEAERTLSLWGSHPEARGLIAPSKWDEPSCRGGFNCAKGSMAYAFEMMSDGFHRRLAADAERAQLEKAASEAPGRGLAARL